MVHATAPRIRRPRFLEGVDAEASPQPPPFLALASEERAERPPPTPAPAPAQEAPVTPPPPPLPPPEPPAALLARYAASIEALRRQAERLAAQARADALEVGFQVARRILEAELRTGPEPLFALIRSALRRAGEARTVVVRLHPADLAAVEAAGGPTPLAEDAIARVHLEPDAGLDRGDCVIEADDATIDGRISTRLAELRRSVEGRLREDEP